MTTNRGLYKTDIEKLMKKALKKAKIDFTEEYPIRCKYGYILDYAIPELKICIECDGEIWHIKGNKKDKIRDKVLESRGWITLRFRGKKIRTNIQSCISEIQDTIKRRLKK